MKLIDILKEVKINNPLSFKVWVESNILEILDLIDIDQEYILKDHPIEIVEDEDEYISHTEGLNYLSIRNKDEANDCMEIAISDDLDDIYEGDGPVSSGEIYKYKGKKFQVQYRAC